MLGYCLKRLLLIIPTLLGIVVTSFCIIQLVPGGPVDQVIAQRLGGNASEGAADMQRYQGKTGITAEEIAHLNALYDFDKPWQERLATWVVRLFTFDFGESYFHHRTAGTLILEKLPVSMSLGIITFLLTYLVCIPLGIAKALKNGGRFDMLSSVIVLTGYSIPGFVLGVALLVLFCGGTFWNIFPLNGLYSDNFSELSALGKIKDYLMHIFLPIVCTTIGSFAVMTQLTKNTVLEHISQQYVLTASAKGLDSRRIIFKHVLKNAMIPLVTGFAGSFLTMFFGQSLLIETLFSLDGLGLLSYQSVIKRDYPVVMASLFIFSLLYLLGNLLSDLMYVMVDPRISFEQKD